MNEFIQNKVLPKVYQISSNKFLKAVSEGFMSIMGVIIVGSIFSLFNSLAVDSYQNFIVSIGLKPILAIPNMVTNDMLAIYATFFIAYNLAKSYDKDPSTAGLISLFTFLAITPVSNTSTIIKGFLTANKISLPEGVQITGTNVWSFDYLGAKGLFVAIIVGLVSATIYVKLMDKGVNIKMPDGVPPTIAKSFGGLVPGFVIIILFMLLNKGVTLIPLKGVDGIHSFVYTILQQPLELILGNNIYSFVFAMILTQVLWFFGVHGVAAVLMPVFFPLWTSLTVQNIQAMNNGVSLYELPNIINRAFFSVYLGASVTTLGVCCYMAFRSKSQRFKALGKLTLPANVCGINEPLTYGMPFVLNPYVFVPLVGAPVVISILAYVCTAIGILPRLTTMVPLGTPIIMSGLLAGGADGWKVALFQIVLVIVCAMIWIPFFKVIDKQAYELELNGEETE
jgi:PTS system cellobiose-specific IIC component